MTARKKLHADEITTDATLVRQLLAAQFPQWADLPIKRVELDGWDNRTFRLGNDMAVRLPSAEAYAAQVDKEHRWLPRLAPLLPLPIPVPLAMGMPAESFPWHWSVYRWLDGEVATIGSIDDLPLFATTLGRFLDVLQHIDPADGPPPGRHNFFRGGPLTTYDAQTRDTIAALHGKIDTDAVTAAWEIDLNAPVWDQQPVWIHGDIDPGNLLVVDGRLSAVIDWGGLAVGDPCYELQPAWNLFRGESRDAYRKGLAFNDATWRRGRGFALSTAIVALPYYLNTNPVIVKMARYMIDEVLADHG